MPKPRKKPLSEEQLADAARLRVLFTERAKLSQERFADEYGFGTQGAVWQYLNGRIPIGLEAAIKFAEGLKCDIADFSPTSATFLARARRVDSRVDGYDIPDASLHDLLRIFEQLSPAQRDSAVHELRAAAESNREVASRLKVQLRHPTDKQVEKALRLTPSRLSVKKPATRNKSQLPLFSRRKPAN